MLYTTIMASFIPAPSYKLRAAVARRLLHRGARAMAGYRGPSQPSISLGLVGPGKLGDEPAYRNPDELTDDVAAARDAGIDDLALYALDGALARDDTQAWLQAFVG